MCGILELLDRRPDLDREHLVELCESYRLGTELQRVLAMEQN